MTDKTQEDFIADFLFCEMSFGNRLFCVYAVGLVVAEVDR